MKAILFAIFLSASMAVSFPAGLRADDHDRKDNGHRYYDSAHKDYHEWNDNEAQAYRRWTEDQHRSYRDISKLSKRDQQQYWKWRHEHQEGH